MEPKGNQNRGQGHPKIRRPTVKRLLDLLEGDRFTYSPTPFPWAPFHQHAEKHVKTRINHVELRFARVLEGPPVFFFCTTNAWR